MERQSDLPNVAQQASGRPGSRLALPWHSCPRQGSTMLPPCITGRCHPSPLGKGQHKELMTPRERSELSLGELAQAASLLRVPGSRRGGGAAAAQAQGVPPVKAGSGGSCLLCLCRGKEKVKQGASPCHRLAVTPGHASPGTGGTEAPRGQPAHKRVAPSPARTGVSGVLRRRAAAEPHHLSPASSPPAVP